MAEQKQVEFGIKEIRQTEFFVDETKNPELTFDLNYRADLRLRIQEGIAEFSITATYMEKESREVFMRGKVETIFTIKDMKAFASNRSDGEQVVDLPEPFWVTLFSLAFSHARASLAMFSGRTKYGGLLLPVINPTVEFRKIFANELKKSVTH